MLRILEVLTLTDSVPEIYYQVNKVHTSQAVFTMLRKYVTLLSTKRYNPEGRGFDSRWCHWNFSLT